MTRLRVFVHCPGNWTHGLNSPERGEGRWSQNYAMMLAMAGHEVVATSGGNPLSEYESGVRLVNQSTRVDLGEFDIYIDSTWWDGKRVPVKAKKYVALKWSTEPYIREKPFPEDFYLAYPYPTHLHKFTGFMNENKVFALPTMFGTEFQKPNWNAEKVFLPGKIDTNRDYKRFIPEIVKFLNKHPIEGCTGTFLQKEFEGLKLHPDSYLYEKVPYNEVIDSMRRSRISVPILNPGCIIEAAFQGVPSVFWSHGGFYNEIGEALNLDIPHDAEPERFTEVTEKLMNDKRFYNQVVPVIQDYFSSHLYHRAIKYFDSMVEEIL